MASVKELWQMSLEEFKAVVPAPHRVREGLWRVDMDTRPRGSRVSGKTSVPYPDEQTARDKAPRQFHWYVLWDAIYAGKPVPAEILAPYPDLVDEREALKERTEAKSMRGETIARQPGASQDRPRLSR